VWKLSPFLFKINISSKKRRKHKIQEKFSNQMLDLLDSLDLKIFSAFNLDSTSLKRIKLYGEVFLKNKDINQNLYEGCIQDAFDIRLEFIKLDSRAHILNDPQLIELIEKLEGHLIRDLILLFKDFNADTNLSIMCKKRFEAYDIVNKHTNPIRKKLLQLV
jgi:hypothetical protein